MRGRTAWATPDYYRAEREHKQFLRTNRAEQNLARDLEENPPPPFERSPQLPGVPVDDAVDRVTYRVLGKLTPADGWVTLATVMRWYAVEREQVFAWVRRGAIDAAMEHGSPTKRFRVLDAATCTREGKAPPVAQPEARKRGRKRTM